MPPCTRREDRLYVPLPKSSFSTSATRMPRSAASRATPQPVTPPPMTSRSKVSLARAATRAARGPGTGSPAGIPQANGGPKRRQGGGHMAPALPTTDYSYNPALRIRRHRGRRRAGRLQSRCGRLVLRLHLHTSVGFTRHLRAPAHRTAEPELGRVEAQVATRDQVVPAEPGHDVKEPVAVQVRTGLPVPQPTTGA